MTLAKEGEDEEFIADLLEGLKKAQRKQKTLANLLKEPMDTCKWHEHLRDGGECYKVKRGWLYS